MTTVFVSYRRSDASDATGRIADRLQAHFGSKSVFYDVDTIPLGIDFRNYLNERLDQCDVFLAVIGDQWISVQDAEGRRRLDDPADNVRIEVGTALAREEIPVIPVLVGAAGVPSEADLPEPLKNLAYRNAIEVRSTADFDAQMARLIEAIERIIDRTGSGTSAAAEIPGPSAPRPEAQTVAQPQERAAPAAEPRPAAQPEVAKPAGGSGSKLPLILGVAAIVAAGVIFALMRGGGGGGSDADAQAREAIAAITESGNSTETLLAELTAIATASQDRLSPEVIRQLEDSIDGLERLDEARRQVLENDDNESMLIDDKLQAWSDWKDQLSEVRLLEPDDLGDADLAERIAVLETGTRLTRLETYANCNGFDCSGRPVSVFRLGSDVHVQFEYQRHPSAPGGEKLRYYVITAGEEVRRDLEFDVDAASGRFRDYFTARPEGKLVVHIYNGDNDLIGESVLTVRP